jgi:hypothetical protein
MSAISTPSYASQTRPVTPLTGRQASAPQALTGLAGGGVPWQQALQQAKHNTAQSLLPNFTLAALLTWLPVPLLHLTPTLGVSAFLASCGFSAATGLLTGKWPKIFRWPFK